MRKEGPVSNTTRYRRIKQAKDLGVSVDQLPDLRGKNAKRCKGEKHHRWNKGQLISSDGYVLVRVAKDHPMHVANGYSYEHRMKMSEHLGRLLLPTEHVHHINGDKKDNRIENLVMLSKGEHNREHMEDRRCSLTGRLTSNEKANTALPNWKKTPWRDPKYALFVRGLPCGLTGDEANEYMAIDPHHEEIPGNSGMSTKASDERQVPIRHDLHVRMESGGNSRASVYEEYGVDPEELILQTQEAWFRKFKTRPWNTTVS